MTLQFVARHKWGINLQAMVSNLKEKKKKKYVTLVNISTPIDNNENVVQSDRNEK